MSQQTTRMALCIFVLAAWLVSLVPGTDAQSIDPSQADADRKTGEAAAQEVIRAHGLYDNPQIQKFFEQLGARLVQNLGAQPFTYRFSITDELEPNAYALPGGHVFATRNIFALANSEAELAGIIGHEIIHSHRRHSAKAARRSILPAILAVPGALVGVFNAEAGTILQAPSTLAMAKYSRKQEDEADELGIKLAAAAGYDPLALGSALDRLDRSVEVFTGEHEKASYFDDHPASADRRQRISRAAVSLTRADVPPILPGRDAYLKLMDGLLVGRNPAQGLLDENVFVHPDLNFRMELPKEWDPFNTAEAFGAIEKKGKGQIVVGLAEGTDPEKAGMQAVATIAKQYEDKPAESRRVDVNGHPGFYALYADKKTHLHLLWVYMGGNMFRVAGVSDTQRRDTLRTSVLSLRPLTTRERADVRVLRLRIEAVHAGETIEAFSKRTDNAFTPALTAVLNDVTGKPLVAGQLLKIGRREPYQTAR